MNAKKKLAIFATLAAALVFAAPALVFGWAIAPWGNLGVSTVFNGYQRDVRVWNNFPSGSANNNLNPDPFFPGATGATLAIFKGAMIWNSSSSYGGKNFDYDWQGTTNTTATNQNIVSFSYGCGPSPLAFTVVDDTVYNGWQIIFCGTATAWSDGPSAPASGQYDIQGVATHELGHALGLAHTQQNFCNNSACSTYSTMCPTPCGSNNGGYEIRDPENDDRNGLQAIYGSIPANKPSISSLAGSFAIGGTLIINGGNFSSGAVVKFTAGTSVNLALGPAEGVVAPTLLTANQIRVVIPAAARDGVVMVWHPGNERLSNPHHIDIGGAAPPPPPPPPPPPTAPVILSVYPSSIPALRGRLDFGGNNLAPVTSINVTNATVFSSNIDPGGGGGTVFLNASQLGPATLSITTPVGTSNVVSFDIHQTLGVVLGSDPPYPAGSPPGTVRTWDFASDLSAYYMILVSPTPDLAYYPFQAIGIFGQPFTYNVGYLRDFIPLYTDVLPGFKGFLNPAGVGHASMLVPTQANGLTVYTQLATWDLHGSGMVRTTPGVPVRFGY